MISAQRFILSFSLILCCLLTKAQSIIWPVTFAQRPTTESAIWADFWKNKPKSSINQQQPQSNKVEPEASVQTAWDGAQLHLLITVTDSTLAITSNKPNESDAVEIYIDLYNDKYPKYEEDDALLTITRKGEHRIQGTIPEYFGAWQVEETTNSQGLKTGYSVQVSVNLGGLNIKNNSKIGLEIGINDAENDKQKAKYYWANAQNNGLNDNSRWATLVFENLPQKAETLPVNYFFLNQTIKKAESLPKGIWQSEHELDAMLNQAKIARNIGLQSQIDAAATALQHAIKQLRRIGPYPDPYTLPASWPLPNPYVFQNGKKLKKPQQWTKRATEIKALAQYYEYGTMPAPPSSLTASLADKTIKIEIADQGRKTSFEAILTLPAIANTKPVPLVVSIDFVSRDASPTYLTAGYAFLSFRYTAVASDNAEHKGAFYELYPYNVATGHDAGTLLAWAWGASRCVDALQYLAKNTPTFAQKIDLNKLVVTGFSRCGKAALAAGLFDSRFGLVSPGASGCGGAAVYRYVSFANSPYKTQGPWGNQYPWGSSPGCEMMGDKLRHQAHNSNEMLQRFLSKDRIYKTNGPGYGERLPYDHHQIIAAIAPRAVLINTATDDYPNNAEGDAISYQAAKDVYKYLGVEQKLGLNIRTTNEPHPRGFPGGHWLSDRQISNMLAFADMVFYQKNLEPAVQKEVYSNPYLPIIDQYFGGTQNVMPWLKAKY
jgi:endo-1,4-beta-xylanase